MNLKARKSILTAIMLTLVLMAMFMALPSEVHAAGRNITKYFGITELNEDVSPQWGYSIMDPKDSSSGARASQIWNIREYQSENDGSARVASGLKDYYCVKAGVGFANSAGLLKKRQAYSLEYDMKSDANEVATKLAINSNTDDSVNRYDALLALLDDTYKLDDKNRDRIAWLRSHDALTDDYERFPDRAEETLLTEGDIMAVQQAAIWYFTNYENATYKELENKPNWLYYTTTGNINGYDLLSDYDAGDRGEYGDTLGQQRLDVANKLYKTLISKAKTNAAKYAKYRTGGANADAPAKLTTEALNYETSADGKNYILGPITITKNSDNPVDYEIVLKLTNGTSSGAINYTLLGENKQSTSSSIKELVEAGKNFYLQVPVSNGEKYKVEMSVNYKTSTIKLYTNADTVTQPLAIPVEKQETVPSELEVEIPKVQKIDLKLLKFVSEINGEAVTDRTLDVDISKLVSGESTTADYKISKNPHPVKNGDIITYKIRVYNEGEINGYAKEITEYIPNGLKYLYSSDPDYSSYSAEEKAAASKNDANWTIKPLQNGKVTEATTDAFANELLKAFDPKKPYSDTEPKNPDYREVTISLKVVEGDRTGEPLRNEAFVTEDADENNKPVDDRDSNPKEEKRYEDDEDYDDVQLQVFDLALRKFIIAKSDDETIEKDEYLGKGPDGPFSRQPQVDTSKLNTVQDGELVTTAEYTQSKTPEVVKVGQYVVYMIRVYNEGSVDGYAAEVKDHLPPNLEFVDGDFNKQYGWTVSDNGRTVTTEYLKNKKINAAVKNDRPSSPADTYTLDYEDVPIMCKVKDTAPEKENITNIADITKYEDAEHKPADDADRDSEPGVELPSDEELPDYEGDKSKENPDDDDDYEKVVVKKGELDLALRKFVVAVSEDTTIDDDEYLKKADGTYTREPQVDTSKLNTTDDDGKKITTAEYNHSKEAVSVQENDIVIYMIRVYNEGDLAGYAAEVTDNLPEYLEFVDGDFNKQYGWTVSEDGRTVTTEYLKDKKIDAAVKNDNPSSPAETYTLDYEDVPIMCKVVAGAPSNENITNIADITKYEDEDHEPTDDRDKDTDPENPDDEDIENVIVRKGELDLALRKFVVAVSEDTTIDDGEYLKEADGTYTREPQVDTSKLNTTDENGEMITSAEYNQSKDPLLVQKNDIVVYVIRVYNEGDLPGYAAEVTDNLPEYLEFVDGDFNKQYGWTVSEDGRTVTTQYLKDKKLDPAVKNDNPSSPAETYTLDYEDVPIMCKVKDTAPSNKDITNIADITKYEDENHNPTEDRDTDPENPDYEDFENVIVKKFDLALKKWATQVIVTDNSGTTVTDTGHQPYDEPEDIVKVELHRKKVDQVTVKFKYSIRVINEGDIEGYATEITDYVPEGLKFVQEDNKLWTDAGNNVIKTTQLKDKLLKPGEYADIEVILTWVNGSMGVKTNTAEISGDDNEYGIPDEDSTPGNRKSGEDDMNDAPVMLAVSTGQIRIYFTLGFAILITLAAGVVSIKKYVLR